MKKIIFITSILILGKTFSYERQTLLETFSCEKNQKAKVAFFDADSTLRESISGSPSANTVTDVTIMENSAAKLRQLAIEGYFVAVVSNQGGVSKGYITYEIAEGALSYMVDLLREEEGVVHYFDFAENYDEYRKPKVGMSTRLNSFFENHPELGCSGIDYEASFMVGDSAYKRGVDMKPDGQPGTDFSNSDRRFAENLGIPFFYAKDFFGR